MTTKRTIRYQNRDRGLDRTLYTKSLPEISRTTRVKRRKALSKDRIYLDTLEPKENQLYKYDVDDSREMTSSFHRGKTLTPRNAPIHESGRKIVYQSFFPAIQSQRNFEPSHKRKHRKGMIIGERPSIWRSTEPRRPQLPSNLFMDNLRDQDIDWRQYDNVTWNDVLDSYQRDIGGHFDYVQTLPQKEAWLASIDSRVRYSKMSSGRSLPSISPRLFGNRVAPAKPPIHTRYLTKDKRGNITYLVGPTDNSQYTPYALPELVKPDIDYKKINF